MWSVNSLAFTEPADRLNAKEEDSAIVPMPQKGEEEILCVVGSQPTKLE